MKLMAGLIFLIMHGVAVEESWYLFLMPYRFANRSELACFGDSSVEMACLVFAFWICNSRTGREGS